MSKFARFASTAAVVALLSACGAKGPLFLPEKPAPEQQQVPEELTPTDPVEAPPAEDSSTPTDIPADTSAAAPVQTPVPPKDGDGGR
jgi:predicted small lipoprotein YifL